jgi:aminopeptidase-like protein
VGERAVENPAVSAKSSIGGAVSCERLAGEAVELVRELYPICRSITGDGVRHSLEAIGRLLPLQRFEVPSGTPVFDWEVPREWNVREAWVKDPDGRKVVDFSEHSLHLVSYSTPFRGRIPLEELRSHLHSIPEHPDWIPYRTSYYRDYWGFCVRHRDLERLAPGEYEVCVDTSLESGSLTYGEAFLPGESPREVLIYTHTCHPSLANDNLTGMAIAALLGRELGRQRTRLSYRFVFGPGTIGSLTWLNANERTLDMIEHGLVLGLLGDPGGLTYKCSRDGQAPVDRVAAHVLPRLSRRARLMSFEPYGYDERQFCSPGFNLPMGRLTRSPNGSYPEYHSSADNVEFIGAPYIAESILAVVKMLDVLESNRTCINLAPKGEPRLGKRGLYGSLGGRSPASSETALLWVLNQADGLRDLLSIADRADMEFSVIDEAARALEQAGLLRTVEWGFEKVGSRH